eukprot:g74559.t1
MVACRSCGAVLPAPKWCRGCSLAAYCDVRCQKKDWKLHKLTCSHAPQPDRMADSTVNSTASQANRANRFAQVQSQGEADEDPDPSDLPLPPPPPPSQHHLPLAAPLLTSTLTTQPVNTNNEKSKKSKDVARATSQEEAQTDQVADDHPAMKILQNKVLQAMESHKRMAKPVMTQSLAPQGLCHFQYVKSPDQIDSNLLILFHGMGDTEASYVAFARALQLPQTAVIALRAPLPLPMDLGWMWFQAFEADGFPINPTASEKRRLSSLASTRARLSEFLKTLIRECGWAKERIFLMGFSAGAQTAIAWAMQEDSPGRFGGIICISSSLMEEVVAQAEYRKQKGETKRLLPGELGETPVFVTHGTQDARVPLAVAQNHHKLLVQHVASGLSRSKTSITKAEAQVQFRSYRKGHEMINSKEEAKDLVRFFSRHLYLRSAALENMPDIVEVKAARD